MDRQNSNWKVGVYVDVANMYRNGGQRMRYDVLREFACRDYSQPMRLNAYVSYDSERAERDSAYKNGITNFHSALRDIGFKVIVKNIHWYTDETGSRFGKADADLDLAVDALLQSENLDRVLIASGDGDFVRVVQALQNKGCRVEVIGIDNVSRDLRQEADMFLSGYLIPNLIPVDEDSGPGWGEIESRVRGWCYWHHSSQSFGFMRFIKSIQPGLWVTDPRNPDSPYGTAFFHDSQLPIDVTPSILPKRSYIFEFELSQSERGIQAANIELVAKY